MPKEVLFKTESTQQTEDIASILEENVAYHLKRGEGIPIGAKGDALVAGNEYVKPNPPATTTFEITVEREGPTDGPGTKSLEFKLVWDEHAEGVEEADGQSESD